MALVLRLIKISMMSELNSDYKMTFEAWKIAKAEGNKENMARHSADLVRIADQMEMFADE